MTVGVDTRLDEHLAMAIDRHNTRMRECPVATNAKGYQGLEGWAIGLGELATIGVEGAGPARCLGWCGHTVTKTNR